MTTHAKADEASVILEYYTTHVEGTVSVDPATGRFDNSKKAPLSGEIIHAGKHRYIALSPTMRGQIRVVSVATGEVLELFLGHASDVWDLDVNATDSVAASGGADGTARVWSMRDGRELLALAVGQGGVLSVEFNSDNSRLLTVGAEGVAEIWDVSPPGGTEVQAAQHGFPEAIQITRDVSQETFHTAFLHDASHVIARAGFLSDHTLAIDLATGEQTVLRPGRGHSSAVSPDGNAIAVARNGVVNVFRGPSFDEPERLGEVRYDTMSRLLAYSPTGTRLALWSNDGLLDIYDAATGLRSSTLHAESVTALLFDEADRLVTTHEDGSVRRWGQGSQEPPEPMQIGSRIGAATIYGNVVIAGDRQGSWQAKNLDTGETVHAPRSAHAGGINAMVVSNTAGLMATAGRDGIIKLWDLNDGSQLMALTEPGPPVSSLAFDADGELLAAIDEELIRVYALDVDRLIENARSRITRSLTEQECLQYLHTADC